MPSPPDTLVLFGEKIRSVRREKGFSQESFALESGLARGYYGGVERGQRNPSATNIIRIAIALGVEVGDLFPALRELKRANAK